MFTFEGINYVSSLYVREITSRFNLKPAKDYFKPQVYLDRLAELKTPAVLSLILNLLELPLKIGDCLAL